MKKLRFKKRYSNDMNMSTAKLGSGVSVCRGCSAVPPTPLSILQMYIPGYQECCLHTTLQCQPSLRIALGLGELFCSRSPLLLGSDYIQWMNNAKVFCLALLIQLWSPGSAPCGCSPWGWLSLCCDWLTAQMCCLCFPTGVNFERTCQ